MPDRAKCLCQGGYGEAVVCERKSVNSASSVESPSEYRILVFIFGLSTRSEWWIPQRCPAERRIQGAWIIVVLWLMLCCHMIIPLQQSKRQINENLEGHMMWQAQGKGGLILSPFANPVLYLHSRIQILPVFTKNVKDTVSEFVQLEALNHAPLTRKHCYPVLLIVTFSSL